MSYVTSLLISVPAATSVSRFEVDESLLTQEVNIIIVILVSTSGLSKNLTLSLGKKKETFHG